MLILLAQIATAWSVGIMLLGGAFSDFAAVFTLLIENIYGSHVFGDEGIHALKYAFLGALVGCASRVLASPISDRLGGGPVTLASCVGVAGACLYTGFHLSPESAADFPGFLWGMLSIFFFSIILASSPPATLYIYWTVISLIGAGITWWFYARKGAEMPA